MDVHQLSCTFLSHVYMIVVTKSSKRYVYETDDIFEINKILKEYIKDKRYSIPTIALQLKYGGVDIKCNGVNFKNVARIIEDKNTIICSV